MGRASGRNYLPTTCSINLNDSETGLGAISCGATATTATQQFDGVLNEESGDF